MQTIRCDVAVVGAGAAGIAAAVAASEAGLQVVLLERHGFVGGLASSAMVGTVCGLYYRGFGRVRYAVQGYASAFAERLAVASATEPVAGKDGLHFLPYAIDTFHQQALWWLQRGGVHLKLHSLVTAVDCEGRRFVRLKVHSCGAEYRIIPRVVIDCTGTGQLSRLAGVERHQASVRQANALVFCVAGLPDLPESALGLALIRAVRRGINQGDLSPTSERLSFVPGSLGRGTALLKLGLPQQRDRTEDELMARALCHETVAYLRGSDPSMAEMSIIAMAPQVGVRSGPRPRGLAVLDEAAVLACAKPDDGVAIGAWPIEFWGEGRKPEMRYFALDDHYLIPAPTLVSRDIDNLFFAGRGISATEMAMASARVIGTCLGTGYATGIMAAARVSRGDWRHGIGAVRLKQVHAASC